MAQIELNKREDQNDELSWEQVDKNWKELELRTDYDDENYDSISKIASKIKNLDFLQSQIKEISDSQINSTTGLSIIETEIEEIQYFVFNADLTSYFLEYAGHETLKNLEIKIWNKTIKKGFFTKIEDISYTDSTNTYLQFQVQEKIDSGDFQINDEVLLDISVSEKNNATNLTPVTGATIKFDGRYEHNHQTPLSGENIIINTIGAIPGKDVIVHVNSPTEPNIVNAESVIKSGKFIANTLNLYHFLWSNANKYILAIQASLPSFFNGDFNPLGLIEAPDGIYQNTTNSAYQAAYAVTDDSFDGSFIFSCDIDETSTAGTMFGLSTSPTNRSFNNATPGDFMAFVSFTTNTVRVYLNGVAVTIDTPTTVTYQPNDKIRLKRVSGSLKLYFNDTEIHDFGNSTGLNYGHISTYSDASVDQYVKNPKIELL